MFIYYTGVLNQGLRHAVTSRELTEGTHIDPRLVFPGLLSFQNIHIKHVFLLNPENKSQGRILQLFICCIYTYLNLLHEATYRFEWIRQRCHANADQPHLKELSSVQHGCSIQT